MARKTENKQVRKCSECIHEYACSMWNVGSLHNTDATSCANYEPLRESNAYYIGYQEGKNEREYKG